MCTGMCVLDPGATPHPPHQHPEEEFMIVASGTGVIEVDGKPTPVGPAPSCIAGRTSFTASPTPGATPMTFYRVQVTAKGFE